MTALKLFALAIMLFAYANLPAEETRERALTVYGAVLSPDTFADMLSAQAELDYDYQFVAVALSKRLKALSRHADLEAEGQIVKHTKGQDHWEFNGLAAARWQTFPWDAYLDTSAAFGVGLSWATESPPFEEEFHEDTQPLLTYLLVELAFSLPAVPRWALAIRIHHRSGAYGLVHDKGASNALGLGIKYRF